MEKRSVQIKPYPLGAHCEKEGIRFAYVSERLDCGVNIYSKGTEELLERIEFSKEDKIGNIYTKTVSGLCASEISYLFWEKSKEKEFFVADPYAKVFIGTGAFGRMRATEDKKALVIDRNFSWEDDENPMIPYRDCIAYQLHIRGFTMDKSSKVKHRGSFAGLVEKLPYLQETGITTVEIQPAYEFDELISDQKMNYWGYQIGYYYAPKAAYAASEDPISEFKNMVKEFHKRKMELVMQFYFPADVTTWEILEILHFWVLEYHVDGFHLIGENIQAEQISKDPLLALTKLWLQDIKPCQLQNGFGNNLSQQKYKNVAEYNDEYLYALRKYLRGDEDTLGSAMYHMRHIPQNAGRIHYLTNYNSLTLKDMFSYDYKHNEENQEGNKDGNAYNYSWNCGEEGESESKSVNMLRMRQIKNAMSILLLSQSTPLLFMGDEFGNSQKGNNNPYCLDNETSWLNWSELDKNTEIYTFWKQLIRIRKEHPILRPDTSYRLMDYIMCGYPDLSYHGDKVWRACYEPNIRHIGQLICGKYIGVWEHTGNDSIKEDDYFFIAINMHWEPHTLELPKLLKGYGWKICIATAEPEESEQNRIGARSIVVYKSLKQK